MTPCPISSSAPVAALRQEALLAAYESLIERHALLADPSEVTADRALLSTAKAAPATPFQSRVQPWLIACFGAEIASDGKERNHRFFEEAGELVQSKGMSAKEAHQLVDYVWGRPAGEPQQEVGGVMTTLAALCLAAGMDMHEAADTELARIWTMVETIRAKQKAKPKNSPLPMHPPLHETGWGVNNDSDNGWSVVNSRNLRKV